MTTHKASFTTERAQDQHLATVEGSGKPQNGFSGYAPSPEQMSAYLYGLLAVEESATLEQRVGKSPSFEQALEVSRQEQALFNQWEDVPVPADLVENTILRIQHLSKDS